MLRLLWPFKFSIKSEFCSRIICREYLSSFKTLLFGNISHLFLENDDRFGELFLLVEHVAHGALLALQFGVQFAESRLELASRLDLLVELSLFLSNTTTTTTTMEESFAYCFLLFPILAARRFYLLNLLT